MTSSIVAVCAESGQIGAAVQTHQFGVGRLVPSAEAGVGVVATQAQVNTAFGSDGLQRLRAGASPASALAAMLDADDGAAHRQVGIVDAAGRSAAHTGRRCIAEASHVVGDGYTTQANMMSEAGVAERMATAFGAAPGPLWERLLAALDAAEESGGDIRGRADGRSDDARVAIEVAFDGEAGARWRELLRRLPATGTIDRAVVDSLLD